MQMMDTVIALAQSPLGVLGLTFLAYADTLIGVGFFVFGEVAFLAAGALWAAEGLWWPALLVLGAAWLGDVTSYAIGRRYGRTISLRFLTRQKRRQQWRRAQVALNNRGAWFVVLSRLLGPTAWVTPFLAGCLGMSARHFLPAAALGVILGVGQFLVYGALGGEVLPLIWTHVSNHFWAALLLGGMGGAIFWVLKRGSGPWPLRSVKALALAVLVFAASNFTYFFVLNPHGAAPAWGAVAAETGSVQPATSAVCDLADGPFQIAAGHTALHLPQPVNVILISDRSPAPLMAEMGWTQNQTFTHDRIHFAAYLRQLARRTPPVSEMYLAGRPADSAFQLPGTLKEREHVRWWQQGEGLYLGAISRDDELAIKYYKHLPVLLHDIAPEVDLSRDMLAAQATTHDGLEVAGYAALATPVADADTADYQTDGRVLVLVQKGRTLTEQERSCLNLIPLKLGVLASSVLAS